MERLTEIKTHVTGFCYADKKEGVFVQDVFAKLAAYEDTGLTPAQVEAMKMDMEQLRADNNNAEMNLAHMTADKDEQAGRIMQMNSENKKLREGLRHAKADLQVAQNFSHPNGFKTIRKAINSIDALLGGKEDGILDANMEM